MQQWKISMENKSIEELNVELEKIQQKITSLKIRNKWRYDSI